jgi:hypothetical protein
MTINARVAGSTSIVSGSISGAGNVKAQTLRIGATDVSLGEKSIQELADVTAAETDKAYLQYNASNDKWESTSVIDGGTF